MIFSLRLSDALIMEGKIWRKKSIHVGKIGLEYRCCYCRLMTFPTHAIEILWFIHNFIKGHTDWLSNYWTQTAKIDYETGVVFFVAPVQGAHGLHLTRHNIPSKSNRKMLQNPWKMANLDPIFCNSENGSSRFSKLFFSILIERFEKID